MNPYDFVPIDWNSPPQLHQPSLHDRFSGVSGKIEGIITAETPVFIFDSPKRNHGEEPFIRNNQGQHIIPGSSLKGLFRNLVETIGNGCFQLFDGKYKEDDQDRKRRLNYRQKLPNNFQKCKCSTSHLCIACRMFGRIPDSGDKSNLHLGNVSFNDAVEVKICDHEAVYIITLMEPKPRHQAFYLDGQRIVGRKFYFHQPSGIQTVAQGNQQIKPIDTGSQFSYLVQFTNLEAVELQTLLYALVLEPDMRHKLGYGKPAGLGSVRFEITKLSLIDYASRYKANQEAEYVEESRLEAYLSQQTQSFRCNTTSPTLNALRRIWQWIPDPNSQTQYRYPGQAWFSANPTTPISGTP